MECPRRVRLAPAVLVGLMACASACAPTAAPMPPPAPHAVALAGSAPFASLRLPDHARPHAPGVPDEIPLRGWRFTPDGVTVPLPVRTRNLYFQRPSPGMVLRTGDGTPVPHPAEFRRAPYVWTYDATRLMLNGLTTPPADEAFTFAYPKATERERALNLATSGLTPEDFVRTTVQVGDTARSGLLLPAPARAAWDLTIAPGAHLRFDAGLAEPEVIDAPPSDGATITVAWTPSGGSPVEVWRGVVDAPAFRAVDVDLSAHAGTGQLAIETLPGPSTRFDYVVLADPVVAPPRDTPRRVFVVFIDTLRPDHLGAYGYHRPTSPAIDALAARGVRFTDARTIAPWTLPSARAIVTGKHPERYDHAAVLPELVRDAGFATAMFAGNIYLGANFDMNRGWGRHDIALLPMAEEQLDRALAWLDAQDGRDTLMLLHLMDPHLPYKEPPAYQQRFLSVPRPPALPDDAEGFHRVHVLRARIDDALERQYLRDRYDNNIRYTDDQLARLLDRVRPEDLVIVLSDHGEEFWEHGTFEHGHSLYDELLRVPLIVAGAGLPQGLVLPDRASLLDITPTVLDALGLPVPADADGVSLLPIMRGNANARAALATRPLGVGRPLYGPEQWGVVDGGWKYTTTQGDESVFDLRADAAEQTDVSSARVDVVDTLRARLDVAHDRPIVDAVRLSNAIARIVRDDLTIEVRLPSGIREVWPGADPTDHSRVEIVRAPDGLSVTITFPAPWQGAREVWIEPVAPMPDALSELSVVASCGGATLTPALPTSPTAAPDGARLLTRSWVGGRAFEVGVGRSARPMDGRAAVSGNDAEVSQLLQIMGYQVGDEPDGAE